VPFKIQKPFNKLEKSTAHLSTATVLAATSSAAAAAAGNVKQSSPAPTSESLQQSINKLLNPVQTQGVGEKRPAGQLPLEIDDDDNDVDKTLQQPQQKRSKSAKLDA